MSNIILLIIFVLFSIVGFYLCAKSIRDIRAPRKYKDVLFTWTEAYRSTHIYDLPSWLATSIHWISVITIGLVVVTVLILHPLIEVFVLPFSYPLLTLLAISLLACSSGLAGFLWGSCLFGPIAEHIGGDSHFAIAEDGLLFAGRLFPWSTFSHFSFDAVKKQIHLWSASSPATIAFTFAPASAVTTSRLIEIIKSHLPASEHSYKNSLKRYIFAARMAAMCAPFVLLAFLMLLATSGLAIVVNSFLLYILIVLGAKLITEVVYGGKDRPALIE
jgi:hypothetical protein